MSTVLVYRIEDPDEGRGPYNSDFIDRFTKVTISALMPKTTEDNHNSPQQDGLTMTKAHFCGCASVEDLYAWFGAGLPALIRSGFKVYGYTIDSEYVQSSPTQVIFERERSTQQVDLTDQVMAATVVA